MVIRSGYRRQHGREEAWTTRSVRRQPDRSRRRLEAGGAAEPVGEEVLKAADTYTQTRAQFGQYSSNPETRRFSQTVIADKARRELLEHQRQQTESLRSVAGSNPRGAELDCDRFLRRFRSYLDAPTSAETGSKFQSYCQARGLNRDTGSFTMGALAIGYNARRTEEVEFGDTERISAAVQPWVTEIRRHAPSAEQGSVAVAFSTAVAEQETIGQTRLILDALPGDSALRDEIRRVTLRLLTNPGATFTGRPRGLTEEDVLRAWAFGYALRCVEPVLRS